MLRQEKGFTLLEILLVISLIGIVSLVISNASTTLWNLFDYNIKLIDLKQQGRVLTTFMEQDIREATDVKIEDIVGDENEELALKFGPAGTDQRDHFRLYVVHTPAGAENSSIYRMRPIVNASDASKTIIGADGWPTQWTISYSSPILNNIIEDYIYTDVYNDQSLIYFEFDLVNDRTTYHVANQAYPRLLN